MILQVDLTGANAIIDAAISMLDSLGVLPWLTGALGAFIVLAGVTAVIRWVRS